MTGRLFTALCLIAAPTLAAQPNPNDDIITPAAALQAKAPGRLAGDGHAATHFSEIERAFNEGKHKLLTFKVFELRDPPADPSARAQERARALGFRNPELAPGQATSAQVVDGELELRINRDSGAETFFDHSRFHKGQGVDKAALLDEGRYVEEARRHLQQSAGEPGADLLDYKKRYYMNATARAGISEEPTVTVYQVAVSFNRTIENRYMAIGPGAKVAVHMSPQGDLVGYENSVRALGATQKVITGDRLLAPEAARLEVEARLAARGTDLSTYRLTRAEFGYFERGRNSVQKYLLPTYAFVYEPISPDVLGRKLVETVPATTDPEVLALHRADEAAEAARKATRARYAGEDDVK